jgi:hypothetical protein
MDIFAHGLWTGAAGAAANRRLSRRLPMPWVVLWGVFPDLFAFTPTFVLMFWLHWFGNPPAPLSRFGGGVRELLPVFLQPHNLYLLSHSLIVFAVVFGAVWLLRRRPALMLLAWPLHILMDIPTHRAGRFGTPFLWPLSDYRFDGISWGQPWFMILNYSALAVCYAALVLWNLLARRQSRTKSVAEAHDLV